MFTGSGGQEEQVLLDWLTHFLVTKTVNMLGTSSKYWKGRARGCQLDFVKWLHVADSEGLLVGGALLVEAVAVVEEMTQAMVVGAAMVAAVLTVTVTGMEVVEMELELGVEAHLPTKALGHVAAVPKGLNRCQLAAVFMK